LNESGQEDLFLTKQQALKHSELIYPTVKPAYENGQMFYFVKKFTIIQLVSLGRARLNQKLGICVPNYHKLTGQDILFASLFILVD
jgi:hypothetical protein